MKNTQKWMVVPFDSDYFKRFENQNQILSNTQIPADVKIQLFNDILTKFLLKKNPEKQLPIENIQDNTSKESDMQAKENFKTVLNELKNKFLNINNSQNVSQDSIKSENSPRINEKTHLDRIKNDISDESMDFSNDNDEDVEVDKEEVEKARLKIKRPKRILDDSLNRTVGVKKKNKFEKETDFLEDAPYQNTRGEKKRNILNNGQIGEGWCIFK